MGNSEDKNLSLFLARRQKRLVYWRQVFEAESLSPHHTKEINEILNTYALLISKLAKAQTDVDRADSRERLITAETRLTTMFEQRRLRTSTLSPEDHSATLLMKPRENEESDSHH